VYMDCGQGCSGAATRESAVPANILNRNGSPVNVVYHSRKSARSIKEVT